MKVVTISILKAVTAINRNNLFCVCQYSFSAAQLIILASDWTVFLHPAESLSVSDEEQVMHCICFGELYQISYKRKDFLSFLGPLTVLSNGGKAPAPDAWQEHVRTRKNCHVTINDITVFPQTAVILNNKLKSEFLNQVGKIVL